MALRSKNYAGDPSLLADLGEATRTVDWEDVFHYTSEAQRGFVLGSTRPYQLFVGARNAGKSHALGHKALYLSLRNGPELRDDGTRMTEDGYIWGRTVKESTHSIMPHIESAMVEFRRATGIPLLASYSADANRYTLVNGHCIWLVSYSDNKSLNANRGPSASWILIEEAAFTSHSADSIMRIAGPSLRPKSGGKDRPGVSRQAFAATSPDGKRGIVGWFVSKWERQDPNVAVWGASVFDCEHIDDATIRTFMTSCTPESADAELGGLVVASGHRVYGGYREDLHVDHRWVPSPGHYWGVGIDWGSMQNAYFCFVDIDPASGRWTVFAEFRGGEMAPAMFRRRLAAAVKEWSGILERMPDIWGSDRALSKEHQWVESEYGGQAQFGTHTNKTLDQQKVQTGIRLLKYMLTPLLGRPRFYLSAGLPHGAERGQWGLRDAIGEYRWILEDGPEGTKIASKNPEQNTDASHSCDGARYLVLASADVPELHGGTALSEIVNAHIRES